MGTFCSQDHSASYACVVVVHRTRSTHNLCAGGIRRHLGEQAKVGVPRIPCVLWFCSHHRRSHHLFVPLPIKEPHVSVVRRWRIVLDGTWHSSHARRPVLTIHHFCRHSRSFPPTSWNRRGWCSQEVGVAYLVQVFCCARCSPGLQFSIVGRHH